MMSSEMVIDLRKYLEKEEENLKKSEEEEREITQKFEESVKNLSLLL